MVDLQKCIAQLKTGECLTLRELKIVCGMVREVLAGEGNIASVSTPVTVCGDIHGQLFDLVTLFQTGGEMPGTSYVFLGDYVDRGHHSVEVLELLLCLKAAHPDRITLIRGNHESRSVTATYGFYQECLHKYGGEGAYRLCCDVFDYMNLGALIDGRVLCLHGGISPEAQTVDELRAIDRVAEIPTDGAFCHIMWDDPDDNIDGWAPNPRGAGYIFGAGVTDAFHRVNGLETLCRAHQVVMDGYKFHFDEKVVTVWSVPNYCYRTGNKACVMKLDEQLNKEFRFFEHTPESAHPGVQDRNGVVPYFLNSL
uniref:Serine/threonine-protein phosphatase n=1 Tax=Phaeomonas parva TaxID=124430 RepID=A0A7S1TPF1_9STRA|mmetsp:Transcript_10800/g.32796  ORF Transcript_10800/g.32796 Transcript_10800/m.32796 type:complete len:310 (+) Transcript_10800:235-1164(+)